VIGGAEFCRPIPLMGDTIHALLTASGKTWNFVCLLMPGTAGGCRNGSMQHLFGLTVSPGAGVGGHEVLWS
jgi:hypothetical protein